MKIRKNRFNSTLVQLKVVHSKVKHRHLKFQFYLSSIKSWLPLRIVLLIISFNSTLVQLKDRFIIFCQSVLNVSILP